MLVIDLGLFHRKAHVVSLKESLVWVGVWVAFALGFSLLVRYWLGPDSALMFLTGYVIELSLSVDNMFVFLLIFSYFHVPAQYQHRVLIWGIIGALIMRFAFILAGVTLLNNFHWMIYVFGAILVYSGYKMIAEKDKKIEPDKNPVLRLFKRFMPVSSDYHGTKFFIRDNKRWVATPLFIVLLVIETSDVIFAVDSVPAILAITTDTFIVYTSNAFAILGLRSLYFSLAGIMGMFRFLHYGLSFILVFIGLKMLIIDWYKIPVSIALFVVLGILTGSIVLSLLIKPKEGNTGLPEDKV